MKYRELGKTGIMVSEIALGCEGFLKKTQEFTNELFDVALKNGINCMDFYSPDPDMHRRVGEALKGHRENFVLQCHFCTNWTGDQYSVTRDLETVKVCFARQLAGLGTDYADIGMIHYVDSIDAWNAVKENGILDYARELKAQGTIRAVGISSHNPIAALQAVHDGIDVLMFSVNPCYDLLPGDEDVEKLWAEESFAKPLFNFDPKRVELYETCQRMGVGITVMKAFSGGVLLKAENSPAGAAMTHLQCLHYALTRPAVGCVMSGVSSLEDLERSLEYVTATDEEKDYAGVFATFPKISWKGYCMYCGHCAPCPRRIDVATVTKFLNLAKAQPEVPETVREHYAVLPAKAGDCIECGACEKRCPFEVPIMENMKKAKALFGC